MPLEPDTLDWRVTNDGVMGGLSQSAATVKTGALRFEGELSLENNGGFASILGELDTPLRRFYGVRLTVAGDGRRYQLRLRENRDNRGVAWRASFEAGETPRRITLLPEAFEPVVRGEKVIGADPLADTPVNHLGFMLSRSDPGAFRLEVRDIEFIHRAEDSGVRLVVGAGRGIGRALLEEQLANPDVSRVIGTYRSQSSREDLEPLSETWGDRLLLQPLDVTDTASLQDFQDFLQQQDEGIDLAIHAAGLLHADGIRPEKSIDQCDPRVLETLFRVNSIGPLMVARAILATMPRKRRFAFAAVSAMVGSIGDNRLGGWYGYRASKAALNQFMRTLAIECRHRFPHAVIVAAHPGTTDTELSRPFQGNIGPGKLYNPKQTADRILRLASGLGTADSGHFFNWDGSEIPW